MLIQVINRMLTSIHLDTIYTIAFGSKRLFLATGSKDGSIKIWDMKHPEKPIKHYKDTHEIGKPFIVVKKKDAVHSLTFIRDDFFLISAGGDDSIKVWNLKELRPSIIFKKAHKCHESKQPIAIAPITDHLIASACETKIKLWDLKRKKPKTSYDRLGNPFTENCFIIV